MVKEPIVELMLDACDFNEWWKENGEKLQAFKEILQAGDYYIAQQAFLAGRKKNENL